MSDNQTFDPADLAVIAENIDPADVVETEDYSEAQILPVGNYLNPSREIAGVTTKKNDEGKEIVTVRLNLTGGVHSDSGAAFGTGKFPFPIWISSRLYSRENRPGATSSLAEYLKACGLDTAGMKVRDMLEILPETLNTPTEVFIGLTDKGVKVGDTWTQANLKTKDFATGEKDEQGKPKYAFTTIKNGVSYTAKNKVQNFRQVRAA